MAIRDIEWKLNSLRKQSNKSGDIHNVIVGTQWQVTGQDEDGNTAVFNGATPFDISTVNTGSFIPYEELTQEIVLGWIKSQVSGSHGSAYWGHISDRIEKEIESNITAHQHVFSDDMPWSPTSGSTNYVADAKPV
ncbi:MAG: hypothetical protein RLZZ196_941 [Bacteroidota bacterium]|jgi:hypothetical protein